MILAKHTSKNTLHEVELASRFPATYTVRLGNLDYELLLDEENRKLNLNSLNMASDRGTGS